MPCLPVRVLRRILSNAVHFPGVVTTVRDWRRFTADYLALLLGIERPVRPYRFRNGITVHPRDAINTAALGEIFVKRAYGAIKEGSIVIDVGAHIGLFALFAATTGRGCTVYAYEPVPDIFDVLDHNIHANGLEDRIIPRRLGLAGTRGPRELYGSSNDMRYSIHRDIYGPFHASVSVECITLEDVFAQHHLKRCNLLRLDCEGAEYECLYSTPPQILEQIDEIRMEYHRGVPDPPWGVARPEHLGCFLEHYGFRVTRYKNTEAKLGLLWATRLGG